MKQFTAAVVLAAAIAAFGTAAYAGEEEDILARIDESNLTESILKNHDNFSLHDIYYDEEDGSETGSDYYFVSGDKFVYEDSGSNVQILENGTEYGFDAENENAPYCGLFMDGAYEDTAQYYRERIIYTHVDGETVLSDQEADGKRTVVTQITADAAQESGILLEPLAEGESIEDEYVLDSETLEILEGSSSIRHADGTVSPVYTFRMTYDTEDYEPTKELTELLNSEDSRTVTLTADPGTDQEKVYSATVGKGCLVRVYLGADYSRLYSDEACTQEKSGENDTQSDYNVYTVKDK